MTPTSEQARAIQKIIGLPFVFCHIDKLRAVGRLRNGTVVRAEYCDEVFNAALTVDAIDEPGRFRKQFATDAQLEVLAIAEREFGTRVEDALPVWLAMNRNGLERWPDERTRIKWPRPRKN